MQSYKNINEYISFQPKETQAKLRQIRALVKKEAPLATETIKYGIPTFVLNKNLVHFAAYKNHIGLYPSSLPIIKFKKELSVYKTSKGAIQFPIDDTLPLKLIEKIIKFQIKNLKNKYGKQ